MAAATEIERLVVRLTGDGAQYVGMLKKASAETQTFVRGIDGRLRDAQGRFVTRQRQMQIELGETAAKLKATALRVGELGRKMTAAGRTLSLKLTAPLTLLGGLAVRSFAKFDQAMTESTSIMQVTTQQIAAMRETAIELSADGRVLQGPEELAKSYFFLASAGKNAAQSMALLPKVSAFATAGAFDMALATDLLTDAQSALGLVSKDVAKDTLGLVRVSDVLVKANTLANATVEQFSIALTSKAGASLKAFGKDVEEGVAVLAAFADQGVKAQLAGNQLDRVIRLLSKASMDNAKAHKRLGFEVFDSAGEMRNLGDIVGNLEDILKGMSDETKIATLDMLGFEARVQQAILPLLGTSEAIKRYEEELRKAGGTTRQVADKQMKSFSNQMRILKNQVTAAAIELGEVLAPIVGGVGRAVANLTNIWRGFSPPMKIATVIIGGMAAALGPLLIVLGTLTRSVSVLIPLFVKLGPAMANVAVSVSALRFAMLGVVGVGFAVFLGVIQRKLAQINAELGRSIESLEKITGRRFESIAGLEGPEREAGLTEEGKRLLKEVELAKKRVGVEKKRQERSLNAPGTIGRGVLNLITGDPLGTLQSELKRAETQLRTFQESSRGLRQQGTGASEFAGLKALVESRADEDKSLDRVAGGVDELVEIAREQLSKDEQELEPAGLR